MRIRGFHDAIASKPSRAYQIMVDVARPVRNPEPHRPVSVVRSAARWNQRIRILCRVAERLQTQVEEPGLLAWRDLEEFWRFSCQDEFCPLQ
jgi:hypothetical protein